jgi:hypothetical protein
MPLAPRIALEFSVFEFMNWTQWSAQKPTPNGMFSWASGLASSLAPSSAPGLVPKIVPSLAPSFAPKITPKIGPKLVVFLPTMLHVFLLV